RDVDLDGQIRPGPRARRHRRRTITYEMYTCQEGVAASGVAGYHRSHSDGDDTRREPPAPLQRGAGRPLPGTALDRPPCPPAERALNRLGAAPLSVAGPPPVPVRGGT